MFHAGYNCLGIKDKATGIWKCAYVSFSHDEPMWHVSHVFCKSPTDSIEIKKVEHFGIYIFFSINVSSRSFCTLGREQMQA